MALAPAGTNPNSNSSSEQVQGQGDARDLADAMAWSLASPVRAVLAQNPLRVPLGRLEICRQILRALMCFMPSLIYALLMAGVSARSVVRAAFLF